MEHFQVKSGLKKTIEDVRDFALGSMYTLPEVSELQTKFQIKTFNIKDQGDTDLCTAYATCIASEIQEEVELNPNYSFALGKEISGDVDEWGQDIRTAMKAHIKGALPEEYADELPLNVTLSRYLGVWRSYDGSLETVASEHRKKSYFKITGSNDHFDNIRAAIFKFKGVVISGVDWSWPLSQVYITNIKQGSGHCISYIGWEDEFLLLQNSYGTKGNNVGVHKVSREVVNYYVEKYGAFMFVDIPAEEAKKHMVAGTSPESSRLVNWFKRIVKVIKVWQ